MRLRFPLMGGLLALTAACAGHHGPDYIAATPLGMPLGRFSSESDARVPVRAWFLRVDANHDGRITLDEFEAEADATFRHYDLDGDGTIMVPELEKARMQDHQGGPDHPPPGADGADHNGPGMGGAGMGGQDAPHPDGGGRRGGGGHGGGSSFPGGVDPIMAADSNVDFRVSREEFRAYAQALFEALDANHDGALTEDEVEAGAIGKAQGRGGPGGGHPGGGMGGGPGGGHGGGMGGGHGGGMGGM